MSEISHCNKCATLMRSADHRDESVEQDGICISCRKLLEQCREEEATQSFCKNLKGPIADWMTNVITECKFEFSCRIPSDINERCYALHYTMGRLLLTFSNQSASLFHGSGDWSTTFYAMTPLPIVLASIKAAVQHESK